MDIASDSGSLSLILSISSILSLFLCSSLLSSSTRTLIKRVKEAFV